MGVLKGSMRGKGVVIWDGFCSGSAKCGYVIKGSVGGAFSAGNRVNICVWIYSNLVLLYRMVDEIYMWGGGWGKLLFSATFADVDKKGYSLNGGTLILPYL